MKRKWLTSDEMRHATHKPGECWENIAKFGNTPRWVVTTWAAVRAKADAEDTPPKYPRSTPEVPPQLPMDLPHDPPIPHT